MLYITNAIICLFVAFFVYSAYSYYYTKKVEGWRAGRKWVNKRKNEGKAAFNAARAAAEREKRRLKELAETRKAVDKLSRAAYNYSWSSNGLSSAMQSLRRSVSKFPNYITDPFDQLKV